MADSSNHSFDSPAFMNIFNSPEHDIWSNNGFLLNSGTPINSGVNHPTASSNAAAKTATASQRHFSSSHQSKGNIFNPQPLPTPQLQHRHSINAFNGMNNHSVNSIFNPATSISAPSSSAQRRSTSHLHSTTSLLSIDTSSLPSTATATAPSTTTTTNSNPNANANANANLTVATTTANAQNSAVQSSPTVWQNFSNTSLEDVSNLNPNTSARSSRFFPSPFENNRTFDMDLNNSNILNGSPLVDNRRSTLPNFDTSSPFHNNTNTPTPQYDSPNVNYFNYLPSGHAKSVTYSSMFNDSNTSTVSNQYSNFSSTPIQHENQPLVGRNTSYPNIDYSFVNMNPLNINNQPNLQLNPSIPQSVPTDDDLMYQMDGLKSQLNDVSFDILPTTNYPDSSFTIPKPTAHISPIHSPSPSSSFLPQLNLKGIHQSSPIKEKTIPEPSPHTPLNQQNLIKLLQLNSVNDTPQVASANIESSTSPTSSNFPSPTLPPVDLFQPSEESNTLLETKPRVTHFINNMITRHNIVYRSFIVSVPSKTPLEKCTYLLENVIYQFGTVKEVELLKSDDEEFLKLRVIAIIADSQLTNMNHIHSNKEDSNGDNSSNDKENDNDKDKKESIPWLTVNFKVEKEDATMLIFNETENTDYLKLDRSGVTKVLLKREDTNSVIENSISSMSKSLTLNNKLDVCWYPEGFSSTFHRRGVNNFMFVRELQSKMIVNRTRVSGGGIVEMGEFRISMPIEEMGFTNDKLNGEKLKRSFLVNIDLKELDGKSDHHDAKKDKHEPKDYSSSPSNNTNSSNNNNRGKFKKRGGYLRGRGRGNNTRN